MSHDAEFRALLARRIADYRAEASQLDARIAELQSILDDLTARLAAAEELYEAEFGDLPPHGHVLQRAHHQLGMPVADGPLSGLYTGMSWASAIGEVLRDAEGPLHIKDIWERLRLGGFRTASRDPLRSVVSIMVRDPGFLKVGPNRYTLAKTPLLAVADVSKEVMPDF